MSKRTICVDVDGVLATYEGWKGLEHIGEPIPGAVEFTKRLSEFADVVIYTTRCCITPQDRVKVLDAHQEITTEKGLADHLASIVKAWLDKHGFAYASIFAGQGKPMFACVIDDRAIQCRPQTHTNAYHCFANTLAAARQLCEGKE